MAVSLVVNQNLENRNRDLNNEHLDIKNKYLEDIQLDAGFATENLEVFEPGPFAPTMLKRLSKPVWRLGLSVMLAFAWRRLSFIAQSIIRVYNNIIPLLI